MNTIISKFSQYFKDLRLSKIDLFFIAAFSAFMSVFLVATLFKISSANLAEQEAAKTQCVISIMTASGAKSYQTTLHNIETDRNPIEFTSNGKMIKSTNYSYECDKPQ